MANSEPHTHTPKLERRYGASGGAWEVTYGDTTVTVEQRLYGLFHEGRIGTPPAPTKGQIKRALNKAMRRHDKASQIRSDSDALDAAKEVFSSVPKGAVWASASKPIAQDSKGEANG